MNIVRLRILKSIIALSLLLNLSLFAEPSFATDELDGVSPLYTTYNTFIKAANFLELLSVGSDEVSAKVSFYKIDGTFQKAIRVKIKSLEQVDLDVNTLIGTTNSYGVIKVEYNKNNPNARLQGRMSIYRLEDDGTNFSFAYALALSKPLTGTSFVTSNTFDPQGEGFVVPNWVSITNLDSATQGFTYNIYDQSGAVLSSEVISLASNERRDLSGSVGSSEAVFVNEIVPMSASAEYLAGVTRYASNAKPSESFTSYLYAMPIAASAGTMDTQLVPITNRSDTCWMQTNWVEVLNVSAANANVTLTYRRKNGTKISTTTQNLAPRAQFHFNANNVLELDNQVSGIASIETDVADSLITQSVIYYHDCKSNDLQSAFNIAGRTSSVVPLSGSFNRFIEIQNELIVFGASGTSRTVDLELRQDQNSIHSSSFSVPLFGTEIKMLNDEEFGTSADTYGLILLDSNQPYPFMAYNIRIRKFSDAIDFALPVPVR